MFLFRFVSFYSEWRKCGVPLGNEFLVVAGHKAKQGKSVWCTNGIYIFLLSFPLTKVVA